MWSKSARFLMVQIRVQGRWGFTLPVSLYLVDELFVALIDVAWLAEVVWIKKFSPSGIISASDTIMKDLRRIKR